MAGPAHIEEPRVVPRLAVVRAFFFASGAAGLVFELAWLRVFVNVFGHTTYSTSAVLAAFMGGMALGGYVFGRRSDASPDPWRLFGWLELGAGLAGLAVPFVSRGLLPVYRAVFNAAPEATAALTAVKFALSGLTMLVPATLMGGTLPVLVRAVTPPDSGPEADPRAVGPSVAGLYAVNTAGAVAGVFAGGIVLIPALGLVGASLAAALMYLAVAVAVLVFRAGARPVGRREEKDAAPSEEDEFEAAYRRRMPSLAPAFAPAGARPPAQPAEATADGASPPEGAPAVPAADGRGSGPVILAVGAACGFASLGCEVVWTRLLVFVIESTVYALTVMLGTFLLGIAIGGGLSRRLMSRGVRPRSVLALSALAAGVFVASTCVLFSIYPRVAGAVQDYVGTGFRRAMVQRFAVSGAVMLPAAVCFGAALPAAAAAYARSGERLGRSVGALSAWNTIGAVAGSLTAGLFLTGFLGSQGALAALGAVAIIAGGVLASCDPALRRVTRHVAVLGSVAAAVAVMLHLPERFPLDDFINVNEPASDLLHSEEGPAGIVAVHHYHGKGVRLISTNGVNVAGTAYELRATQKLQAALPLVLHGDAESVLQVGYGSGETSRMLVAAGVDRLSVVEINPRIIPVAAEFFDIINSRVDRHPRFHPIIMDGANLVRLTNERFDLVMNDSIWPHLPGCSGLYTREYFADARSRLRGGGMMTSWLPLELNAEALSTVLATFLSAWPHSTLWSLSAEETKHALLVGTPEPLELEVAEVKRRIDELGLAGELAAVGIASGEDLLGTLLVGEEGLRRLAAGAGTNSRSKPILEFMTSRRRSTDPRERMSANLARVLGEVTSSSEICRGADAGTRSRLEAAASARRDRIRSRTRTLAESAAAAPLGRRGDEALNAGRTEEAVNLYRQALAVARRDGKVHLRLAMALASTGRSAEALHHYRRAAEYRPHEAEGWWGVVRLAPIEEARSAYARVRRLDPWAADKIRFVRTELSAPAAGGDG